MSATDTNVILTQYRAEFRAEPFGRPRWTITSSWQYRETLPRRRRSTVVRDVMTSHDRDSWEPAARVPDTGIGHIRPDMLMDTDAAVVFIPDTAASRYGTAVVVEQVTRRPSDVNGAGETIATYADGFGNWHARITFPAPGYGPTYLAAASDRLRTKARRAIRSELLARAGDSYRLAPVRIIVHDNRLDSMNRMLWIDYAESPAS